MALPTFGVKYTRIDDQPVPVLGANLDVVGIVGPCSSADPNTFPLNTPVLVFSNDTATLALLGTDGYIPDAINAINSQLADFQFAAQIVIVVTPYGTAADANLKLQQTIARVMGDSLSATGVWAFLKAPNLLYCTPRIILAPGYTGQMANSLNTLAVVQNGVGYKTGTQYQVTFAPGAGETNSATLVLPQAYAIGDTNGQINTNDLTITSFGAWFSAAPIATLPPPDGTPPPAAAASGQIIFQRLPGVGSTITFNGTVVTFVSGAPGARQVQLTADLASTLANLLAFLNSGPGQADPQIGLNTYQLAGGTLTMTQKATGTAGNSYTLATTITGASITPTLTGGQNASVSTQATLVATRALGANPVCATLSGGVLDSLMGTAWVESSGIGMIDDENWRDTLDSQRIIPISGGVKIQDPVSGNIIVMPAAPRIAGLQIAKDFETGYPFHSAANRPVSGIVGPARTIEFNLTSGDNEGQVLLAANIGIIVRGLIGVETAISSGGFVYIGTDNSGSDPLWQFYNVVRGRDYIELSLLPALRVFLGQNNIDAQTIMNILGTIRGFLQQLQAFGQILGFKVNFEGPLNTAAEIRAGHLTVGFQAEEPPVLRRIQVMSARYAPAIDALVSQLEQQLSLAA